MARRPRRYAPAAWLLGALAVAALFAPWLTRSDPTVQHDPVHGSNLAPMSRRFEIVLTSGAVLLAESVAVDSAGRSLSLDAGERTLGLAEIQRTADGDLARERHFPLGTDRLGRDLWSRLLFGSRISLAVAVLAALLASLLGLAVGGGAVLGGPVADALLMRLTDGFNAFPTLFLLLMLAAFLDASTLVVVLVLGATSWMPVGRLARSELLRLESAEMTLAARATGSSRLRILFRHLLPNAMVPVIVSTTLRIGDVLLLEAALSFLGLGIRPPTPSWGNMIADGAADISTAWWTSTLPGLAIVATVVAFNLAGDELQARLQRRPSSPVGT